jgi:hypothetical protein
VAQESLTILDLQRLTTLIGLTAPALPMTPRKKIKAKRKANSPIPAITPIKMAEI